MMGTRMDSTNIRLEPFRPLNNIQYPSREPGTFFQYMRAPFVKQEKMEEKDDSGNDFHSSSPGSNNIQEWNALRSQFNPNSYLPQAQFIGPHFAATSKIPPEAFNLSSLNQNPLTPPDSITDRASPASEQDGADLNNSAVMPSPLRENVDESQDHIKCLEMSVNQSLAPSESSDDADQTLTNINNNGEDKSLKIPRTKSHAKDKNLRCKYCELLLESKEALWIHHRTHIPENKQLKCTFGCPFVTDLKHHLEYHLRRHTGAKPHKCDQCDYRCSTKSMLTSHEKSHTTIYQYSCLNCPYATKYCHSLKTHLRKHGHEPDVVLDEKGKPCPEIVIDVYGKRRGPKRKKPQEQQNNEQNSPSTEAYDFTKFMQAPPPYIQFWQLQAVLAAAASAAADASNSVQLKTKPQEEVLDLSMHGSDAWQEPPKKRRKNSSVPRTNSWSEENKELRRSANSSPASSPDLQNDYEDASCTTMFSNVEAVVQAPESPQKERPLSVNEKNETQQKCDYCNMTFGNKSLYHLHMSYHGSPNPFTCNMCKEECIDTLAFNLHIMRVAH